MISAHSTRIAKEPSPRVRRHRVLSKSNSEYQISEVSASDGYTVDDEIYNLKMEITQDDNAHKYVATRTVTTKKQGVIELAEFSFTNQLIPPETAPETTPPAAVVTARGRRTSFP